MEIPRRPVALLRDLGVHCTVRTESGASLSFESAFLAVSAVGLDAWQLDSGFNHMLEANGICVGCKIYDLNRPVLPGGVDLRGDGI